MEKVIQKPFEKMKKISLDLNEEVLELIDEIANLTETNRTAVIGALIGKGMTPFFRYLEITWEGILINGNPDGRKKKKIKNLLQDLKKVEVSRWDPQAL